MAENLNFNSKNGISLSLASLASLARNLEFSLASRKTSKMQEIGHCNCETSENYSWLFFKCMSNLICQYRNLTLKSEMDK